LRTWPSFRMSGGWAFTNDDAEHFPIGLTSTSTHTVIIEAADAPSIVPMFDASTTTATTTTP
jgi:hypothetical protein